MTGIRSRLAASYLFGAAITYAATTGVDAASLSARMAESAPTAVPCVDEQGIPMHPAVLNKRTARQIYIAVARGLGEKIRLSELVVNDDGAQWSVTQAAPPTVRRVRGANGQMTDSLTLDVRLGTLDMTISKCNAAIRLSYAR